MGLGATVALATAAFALFALFAADKPGGAQASGSPDIVYRIEQGAFSQLVAPLEGDQSVVAFYAYVMESDVPDDVLNGPFAASSARTDLEVSETSLLFLYRDDMGEMSIVVIHDRPEAQLGETPATGGQVNFTYTGLPATAAKVVGDDPVEGAIPNASWAWVPCCTDGNAVEGGLNGPFAVTITPDFIDGIDTWQFLSGPSRTSPTRIGLDLCQPVTIYAEVVGPTSIEVSKTADFDGRYVSGTISISNVGENPAIISAIADSLEVHFPRKDKYPPPLPEGSTPNWLKVADVPVEKPGPIPVGETVNIDYSFDLCDGSDPSGANSMRNVVAVTLSNKPEGAQKDTVVTRSDSFKPTVPECPPLPVP